MSDPQALDMTLDDLIKKNKPSRAGRGGGASGGRGGRGGRSFGSGSAGPARRNFKRRSNRPAPYSAGKVQAPDGNWQHDLFAEHAAAYPAQVGGRASAIETGTKLFISNLDYGVSNEDIKELFSEAGDIKRFGIHYDRSGRSKGTADVVYSRRQDAMRAVKQYNNVQLDGKPMKIEIVGTNNPTVAAPLFTMNVNQNSAPRSGGRGRGGLGRAHGGGGGGRGAGRGHGRGSGRGRGRGEKPTQEQLDAELEKYHAENAMEV